MEKSLISITIGLFCLWQSVGFINRAVVPLLPDGQPDFAMVVADNTVIFDVLENDTLNGEFRSLHIFSNPSLGRVYVNEDWSLTYEPKPEICEEKDEFHYILENEFGADTVLVVVEILCEPLTIVNGFTPDGDGQDDFFTILGVENFPNNTLHIFNGDGGQILERIGYQNDWDGVIDGKKISPHEMYYYVFSDGAGRFLSGYVQISISY